MARNDIKTILYELIDVGDPLKFFVAILILDADAVSDELDRVDDLERHRILIAHDFTVASVIDSRKSFDASSCGCGEGFFARALLDRRHGNHIPHHGSSPRPAHPRAKLEVRLPMLVQSQGAFACRTIEIPPRRMPYQTTMTLGIEGLGEQRQKVVAA